MAGTGKTLWRPAVLAVLCATTVLLAAPAGAFGLPAMAPARATFSSDIRPIDDALAARMRWSWRRGCPVPLGGLRYVTLTYHGFDGRPHMGELVVRRGVARGVVGAFHRLYDQRFPIQRMRLIDDYRGVDGSSMKANNTSAFNCRAVTGGRAWSQHSYGWAIDINPVQNPYVAGHVVEPAQGVRYLKRAPLRRGMFTPAARKAFTDLGWGWGGRWRSLKDYMHVSSNNR